MTDPHRDLIASTLGENAAWLLCDLTDDQRAQVDADNHLALAQAGREEQLAEDD
jgi:hypothetical protein